MCSKNWVVYKSGKQIDTSICSDGGYYCQVGTQLNLESFELFTARSS